MKHVLPGDILFVKKRSMRFGGRAWGLGDDDECPFCDLETGKPAVYVCPAELHSVTMAVYVYDGMVVEIINSDLENVPSVPG